MDEMIGPMSAQIDQQQLAQQLVESARSEGVELVGPDGVLTGLTKQVLETALEAEMSEHLGYEPHDPAGHHSGNSRNGTRSKTVHTEIGPVQIDVPRDRDGSFEPQLVKKRQRRLSGVDENCAVADRARSDDRRGGRTQRPWCMAPPSARTPSAGSPTRWSTR